jgi:hypothetical protein
VILKDAPFRSRISTRARKTGRRRWDRPSKPRPEGEVNAAIARGGHQVETGMFLVTPEEKSSL